MRGRHVVAIGLGMLACFFALEVRDRSLAAKEWAALVLRMRKKETA